MKLKNKESYPYNIPSPFLLLLWSIFLFIFLEYNSIREYNNILGKEEGNMIKVFLVEDEKIIRKSIKNNVKWEENGFEFAGEAPDGEMALPMIEKLHPDIVITDIKMPFMDGLELSDILKKKMPKIQIIILSGYGEFDYAKEAIKIGVTDYLTKPVTGEQLLEALNKVKTKA